MSEGLVLCWWEKGMFLNTFCLKNYRRQSLVLSDKTEQNYNQNANYEFIATFIQDSTYIVIISIDNLSIYMIIEAFLTKNPRLQDKPSHENLCTAVIFSVKNSGYHSDFEIPLSLAWNTTINVKYHCSQPI